MLTAFGLDGQIGRSKVFLPRGALRRPLSALNPPPRPETLTLTLFLTIPFALILPLLLPLPLPLTPYPYPSALTTFTPTPNLASLEAARALRGRGAAARLQRAARAAVI